MISALLLALGALAPQTAATITLAEVEPAKDAAGALSLARRIMPAEVAARIAEAKVRRQWAPGQVWWIGAVEPATVTEPDLCERKAYAVEASAPSAPGDAAPADTKLTLWPQKSWREVAVMPIGTPATPANCVGQVYIARDSQGDRRIAAYRVLRSAMAAAGGTSALPFAITCHSDDPVACQDARKALADLPMRALRLISASCREEQKVREGNMITCPALEPGQPYQANVMFEPTGKSGRSWIVTFVHGPGWPQAINMRQANVVYH